MCGLTSIPPPPNNKFVPPCCFTNTSFHSTTHLLNPILPNPMLPIPCCAPYTLPLGSTPAPTMSLSKPFSPLTPIITPTLHDHSHTNLVPWKIAFIGLCAVCSPNGMPSGSCSAYATTQSGLSSTSPPGQQLRARPDFPIPADLQGNAGSAARDAFKRATDARATWLACSAAFCVVILDSIGESNRLAISDPDTDTLHSVPATHHQCDDCSTRGTDGCRGRRLVSVTPPTLGASTPTSSPTPPFDPSRAMSKGTKMGRARMMAWEETQSTQLRPHHYTPNTLLPMPCNPITLLTNLTLLNNFYHPPLALGSTLTPTPWPMGFTLTLPPLLPLPLPTHPQTRKATDKKATRKARKARHRLIRQRQGHLTPTSLVPLCLALLNCISIATSMAG